MPPVRDTDDDRPLRVLIVDAHEVSLVAYAALLRTEGLVVADVTPTDPVIELARAFEPDVLDPSVRQLPFLAKADVCAEAILRAVAVASDEPQVAAGS